MDTLNREQAVYACRKRGLHVDSRLCSDYVDAIVLGNCKISLPSSASKVSTIFSESEFLDELSRLDHEENCLWPEKYVPTTLQDLVGKTTQKATKDVISWLKNRVIQRSTTVKSTLLLSGPPGCGKNSAVAIALSTLHLSREYVLELCIEEPPPAKIKKRYGTRTVEKNNTDFDMLLRDLTAISSGQYPDIRVVWIKDIDHIGNKRIFSKYKTLLEKLILRTAPTLAVVLTTNGIESNTFTNDIRLRCDIIRFSTPTTEDSTNLLLKVCKQEGLQHLGAIVPTLSQCCYGDIRKALIALQVEAKTPYKNNNMDRLRADLLSIKRYVNLAGNMISSATLRQSVVNALRKEVKSIFSLSQNCSGEKVKEIISNLFPEDNPLSAAADVPAMATNRKKLKYDNPVKLAKGMLSKITPTKSKRLIMDITDREVMEKTVFIMYRSMLQCKAYDSHTHNSRANVDCMENVSAAYDALSTAEAFQFISSTTTDYLHNHQLLGMADALQNADCSLALSTMKEPAWARSTIPTYYLLSGIIKKKRKALEKTLFETHVAMIRDSHCYPKPSPPYPRDHVLNYYSCLSTTKLKRK